MSERLKSDPTLNPQAESATLPTGNNGPTQAKELPSSRYDANLSLLRRRLADEQRTSRTRRWWKLI